MIQFEKDRRPVDTDTYLSCMHLLSFLLHPLLRTSLSIPILITNTALTATMQTHEWTLTNKPITLPTLDGPNPTFTLNTITLPPLQPNQVLIKHLYLSNAPGMRPWISATADPKRQYLPPIHEGDPKRTTTIARVCRVNLHHLTGGHASLRIHRVARVYHPRRSRVPGPHACTGVRRLALPRCAGYARHHGLLRPQGGRQGPTRRKRGCVRCRGGDGVYGGADCEDARVSGLSGLQGRRRNALG